MIKKAKNKIYDIALERCGSCPAYYCLTDYWGEADEGCRLYKDINEFCPIALLPKPLAKLYIDFQVKREDKRFLKWYEKEGYKDEE